MGFLLKSAFVIIVAFIFLRLLPHEPVNYFELLRGKNVLITGASSGIGEEMAYYCAKMGANVVIAARREALLKKITAKCSELSPNNGKFQYIVADFAKVEESDSVVTKAVKYLGSLDFLILNHALLLTTTEQMSAWTGSSEQHRLLKESLDVNLLSGIRLADRAMPLLRAVNGSLAAVSSMMVENPRFAIPYATSKAALNTFYTGLRQEQITLKHNVSVTIIHLGSIPTEHAMESLSSYANAMNVKPEVLRAALPITPVSECAQQLVRAIVCREGDVYYPTDQGLWLLRLLRLFFNNPDATMIAYEPHILAAMGWKQSMGW